MSLENKIHLIDSVRRTRIGMKGLGVLVLLSFEPCEIVVFPVALGSCETVVFSVYQIFG